MFLLIYSTTIAKICNKALISKQNDVWKGGVVKLFLTLFFAGIKRFKRMWKCTLQRNIYEEILSTIPPKIQTNVQRG